MKGIVGEETDFPGGLDLGFPERFRRACTVPSAEDSSAQAPCAPIMHDRLFVATAPQSSGGRRGSGLTVASVRTVGPLMLMEESKGITEFVDGVFPRTIVVPSPVFMAPAFAPMVGIGVEQIDFRGAPAARAHAAMRRTVVVGTRVGSLEAAPQVPSMAKRVVFLCSRQRSDSTLASASSKQIGMTPSNPSMSVQPCEAA